MNCRLCNNTRLKFKFKVKNINLYECNNCAYLQIETALPEKERKRLYALQYFLNEKYSDLRVLSKEYKRRLRLMEEFLPEKELKILDYGCGAGNFMNFINDRYVMYGVDISEGAIRQAAKLNPKYALRLQVLSDNCLHGMPNFFDAIVMWDVIEHIWDPAEAFQKLFACLKPSGYLFISTPNLDALTAKMLGRYWWFMTPPEHTGLFSQRSLEYLFEIMHGCAIKKRISKGRWVNSSFLFYKMKRIFPKLIPNALMRFLRTGYFKYCSMYAPTGDVNYLVIQKGSDF